MGTDIHLHTEIKVDGVWLHYGVGQVRRDYDFFTYLAGVRQTDGITPLSEPKGIPEGISEVTRMDLKCWDGDAHSHSYLTAIEIARAEDWIKERFVTTFPSDFWGYLFSNSWSAFMRYREDLPKEIEDIRFVFWFDC